MARQKITILIDSVPSPEKTAKSRGPSVEERIQDALDMIDSGHESRSDWEFIRRVNNCLMKKPKLSTREKDILAMIQPCIKKHGMASGSQVEQDSDRLAEIGELI